MECVSLCSSAAGFKLVRYTAAIFALLQLRGVAAFVGKHHSHACRVRPGALQLLVTLQMVHLKLPAVRTYMSTVCVWGWLLPYTVWGQLCITCALKSWFLRPALDCAALLCSGSVGSVTA